MSSDAGFHPRKTGTEELRESILELINHEGEESFLSGDPLW